MIGIIYSKDLIGKKGDSVASLMREPYMVLDSLEASSVFKEIKSNRVHIGSVRDDKVRHVRIVTL